MPAAVGITVKSGWASAVLLTGSKTAVTVVDSRRLELSDPAIPDSRQPYHAGFGTARDSGSELSRLVSSVKQYGRRSVTTMLREHERSGHALRGVGVVVGSLIDPDRIGNAHIRIHALEGQLFRTVVQDAAHRRKLDCQMWRNKDLYSVACERLGVSEPRLRSALTAMTKSTSGPWRAEEKAAAVAAWLVIGS